MPPGWMDHVDDAPAATVRVAMAGRQSNGARRPRRDSASRWCRIKYEDLVADAPRMLDDLLAFSYLPPSRAVDKAAAALAPSQAVLSAPDETKWREPRQRDRTRPRAARSAAAQRSGTSEWFFAATRGRTPRFAAKKAGDLEVLAGGDAFDGAAAFGAWSVFLGDERAHVDDPFALLARDLQPVVGVGGVR